VRVTSTAAAARTVLVPPLPKTTRLLANQGPRSSIRRNPRPRGKQCAYISPHVLQLTALTATRPAPSPSTPGKGGACYATASSSSTTRARCCPAAARFRHTGRFTSNSPSPPETASWSACVSWSCPPQRHYRRAVSHRNECPGGQPTPGRTVRAASVASAPVAARATVKPAASSSPGQRSGSRRGRLDQDRRRWLRASSLAPSPALGIRANPDRLSRAGPPGNSGRGPIRRAPGIPNVGATGHQ